MTGVALIHLGMLGWLITMGELVARPQTGPAVLNGRLVSAVEGSLSVKAPAPSPPTPARPAVVRPPRLPAPATIAPKQATGLPPSEPAEASRAESLASSAAQVAEPASTAAAPTFVTLPRSDAAYLNNPEPIYPRLARRLRQQGRVLLEVYILPTGLVGELKVKQSSGHAPLDDSAIEAVRTWHFVPATRGGHPIPYWYTLPIDFSLDP
ncbi:MAG TPA: energy transducer TonB [Aquabacterium sp.]|nr:energy transducer TonB [Aquabacterium sp.]